MVESTMKPATQLAAALNEGDWQRDQAPKRASGGGRNSPPPLLGRQPELRGPLLRRESPLPCSPPTWVTLWASATSTS
jgi:hypothetical protein